jgi:hypothetical protein
VRGPIADLTATLITAWTHCRAQDALRARSRASIACTGTRSGMRSSRICIAGLIFDVSGNSKEAGKRFESVYKLDGNRAARGRAYDAIGTRAISARTRR